MNNRENLILIKEEDKTDNIISCEKIGSKYCIKFSNNKEYFYNEINVKWLKKPSLVKVDNRIVYIGKEPLNNIKDILKFDNYAKIFFSNGYTKAYLYNSLIMNKTYIDNKLSCSCLEYLKKLSKNISSNIIEDKSFLNKEYDKLKDINNKSVLATYLSASNIKVRKNEKQIIFPFGFNISQEKATKNALTNSLSIIEGPPGTGKTQTILNIIANAILNNQSIAIVSNNNAATANIYEKLEKYGVEFICAYLGNNENKTKFFESQSENYPPMEDWVKEKDSITKLEEGLIKLDKRINEMLIYENRIAELKAELAELVVETEYFNKYYNETKARTILYKTIYKETSNSVISLLVEYELLIKKYGSVPLKFRIKNFIRYGIISFKFYNNSSELIVDNLKRKYYNLKQNEINNNIKDLEKKLENFNFDNERKRYSEDSITIFKDALGRRVGKKNNRTIFSRISLNKQFSSFISEYPVILSTTHSLRTCIKEGYLFDFVIIDEASQVDIVTGALALSCAKNTVVVGDLMQLPNIVSLDVKDKCKVIFKEFNINKAYNYTENSLLSSITTLYDNVPKTLLKEHYRCHPKIIGFCNKKFYNDELIILTNETENDMPLQVYKTVSGNHARGNYNQRQIDVIEKEILPLFTKEGNLDSIGIISPYKDQKNALQKQLKNTNIEIDTVHKFQGREKDTIILTTVANEINDFIDNSNLVNVAISRAQNKLILVVADYNLEGDNSNITDLIKYIEYNNFEIINSEIYSVFDLLYKCHDMKLKDKLKNSKEVSKYASENLMNTIIEEVLKSDKFKSLDKVLHQPLKMLIKDHSKLTKEEYKFVRNINTHTDFVIFSKVDKMPILVVEVDGYAYHDNNKKQLERDKMKDGILNKYDLPILRIKTIGSNEKAVLENKISEILYKNKEWKI